MAQPGTRGELIGYVKRKLGAPVLEVNVSDDQFEDIIDDSVQYFHERHYDGVIQTYLKYKVSQADIDRGRAPNDTTEGYGRETTTSTIVGTAVSFAYEENANYLQIPDSVIGVNKIFAFDELTTSGLIGGGMNGMGGMLGGYLNSMSGWGAQDILSYYMSKSYTETLNYLLRTHKQIRYNKRQDRLYLDINFSDLSVGDYLIIDCWRILNPGDAPQVWNDSFLKKYASALAKKQWGMNLIKFNGVRLPGGVELNGRQIYDDGQREIDDLMTKSMTYYEMPPLDLIG